MLQFISGIFNGWKHETFGGCFLDYVWLIQEELPQSPSGGGVARVVPVAKPRPFRPSVPILMLPKGWRDRDAEVLMTVGAL